jgi:hypothetical protein
MGKGKEGDRIQESEDRRSNDKVQNPNVKGMSKVKAQNIWHWGLELDLAFGI